MIPSLLALWRGPWILRRYADRDCAVTLELRQRWAVALTAACAVWYALAPGQAVALILAALLALLALGLAWARSLARGVRGRRELRSAAVQVGDQLEESFHLDNRAALPVLWAEFVDRSSLPGRFANSVRAVEARSSLTWRVATVCRQRGLFQLGRWELRLGDPFGLFLVRQHYTASQELLVYPPLARLPESVLPRPSRAGELRRLRQPLPAQAISAAGIRHYAPGDPLRRIHWPTTARRAEPYVKVFDPEAASTLWLVPDFDRSVHLGQGPDSTEETLVLLTASLVENLLRRRLAVGLLAQTAEPHALRPRAGLAHLWEFLRLLAPLHADCPAPLAVTLAQAQAAIQSRDLVVVITPSLDLGWTDALRHAGRMAGVEAILLDPASFGGRGQAANAASVLHGMGLGARVVRRGELQPIPGAYGALRRWEFMTLGTGRAIVRQTPQGGAGLRWLAERQERA